MQIPRPPVRTSAQSCPAPKHSAQTGNNRQLLERLFSPNIFLWTNTEEWKEFYSDLPYMYHLDSTLNFWEILSWRVISRVLWQNDLSRQVAYSSWTLPHEPDSSPRSETEGGRTLRGACLANFAPGLPTASLLGCPLREPFLGASLQSSYELPLLCSFQTGAVTIPPLPAMSGCCT